MNDDRRAYDPDEYFGKAPSLAAPPDLKKDARERLDAAALYADLHDPEGFRAWLRRAVLCYQP